VTRDADTSHLARAARYIVTTRSVMHVSAPNAKRVCATGSSPAHETPSCVTRLSYWTCDTGIGRTRKNEV
jgi:hypothetical protein